MIEDMDLTSHQTDTLGRLASGETEPAAYVAAVDGYRTDVVSGFSVEFPSGLTGAAVDVFVNMYRLGSVERRPSGMFVAESRDGTWYVPPGRPVEVASYMVCGSIEAARVYVRGWLSRIWNFKGENLDRMVDFFDLEANVRW